MSSTRSRRAWTVAVSVGVVETLKDQGLCRWNSGFKSAQKRVKSHVIRSLSQAKKLSSSSSAMVSSTLHGEKEKQPEEESLRTLITWAVAASTVGVVEALKDQGLCRWNNNALRSAQHQLKNHVTSLSQPNKVSTSSSAVVSTRLKEESEESFRTVMYLSCWCTN
ncbi:hypothetical protein CR513_21405, partial [Mucuna pruriens]